MRGKVPVGEAFVMLLPRLFEKILKITLLLDKINVWQSKWQRVFEKWCLTIL
jgi:hypothetical protein